jgi:peptidyl-tRNA hydrolase, PTH1 family
MRKPGRNDPTGEGRGTVRLVAGLGNPGTKYERSRHNVGFDVVDQVAKTNGGEPFRSGFDGVVSECVVDGERILLLKPLTYMNRSGASVRKAVDFYKLPTDAVLVVCDDFSLPLGQLRFRGSGSAGGQNGLKDVISALGTDAVPRLRIGIDPPPNGVDPVDYVLSGFRPAERRVIEDAVIDAGRAVEAWCRNGLQAAMNEFNAKKAKE